MPGMRMRMCMRGAGLAIVGKRPLETAYACARRMWANHPVTTAAGAMAGGAWAPHTRLMGKWRSRVLGRADGGQDRMHMNDWTALGGQWPARPAPAAAVAGQAAACSAGNVRPLRTAPLTA